MSDIHNHILCGEYSFKRIKALPLGDIVDKNKSLFEFGCMGGDIFYYFHVMNARSNEWANNIGDRMHEQVDLIFKHAFEFIVQLNGTAFEKAIAYMMGFINHHALDARTHPYINYFAGCKIEGMEYTYKYNVTHKRFEVLLDLSMAEYLNAPLSEVERIVTVRKDDVRLISNLYQYIIKKKDQIIIPDNMLSECLNGFRNIMYLSKNMLYLHPISKIIDRVIGRKYHTSRTFFLKRKKEIDIDVLNLKHRLWQDPCNQHIYSNHSYPELFEYAVRDSVKRMSEYYLSIENKQDRSSEIFQSISFITGCKQYHKTDIKYTNIIL